MFKNILLATAFSKHSEVARSIALSLAKEPGKKVFVLHVYDSRQKFLDEGVLMASELVEAAENKRFREEAEVDIKEFCKPLDEKGISYTSEIREGKAADEILATAKEINADLIIIGSHAKRGFIDVSLGGVSRKVGELASCPVLIATSYKEDEENNSKPAEETTTDNE